MELESGTFNVLVRRLPPAEREEAVRLVSDAAKASNPKDAAVFRGRLETSLREMVISVDGLAIENAEGEQVTPTTLDEMKTAAEVWGTQAWDDLAAATWKGCMGEQHLSPFRQRPSASSPAFAPGSPESSSPPNGGSTPTASPAAPPASAESGAATETPDG